ncbi:hypothetical protein CVD19_07930 [Bacillus sp. T33-2]|nr:hypothetical protein CVD19_07930 [Bacillus sp. T33-2]
MIGLYFGFTNENEDKLLTNEKSVPKMDDTLGQPMNNGQKVQDEAKQPAEGIASLMGKDIQALKAALGEPARIDPSAYGFEWWIYNQDLSNYVQAGVLDGRVVSMYGIGPDVNVAPFKIGQPVEEIFALNIIQTDISFEYQDSSFKFELSEEDMNARPLVQMGSFFAQLHFDKFTGSLSSIRFLDGETLIKQRPYEMVYRGNLIEAETVDGQAWLPIEDGTEQQILDITNVIRLRHKLEPLKWDDKTAEVAYAHSRDMQESNYFSHTSKKYGSISDRLKAADIAYQSAGENIAANYTDAPAVVEGWLNSKGHREALLNEKFTHLGVGVYQKHYTQNFIKRWED